MSSEVVSDQMDCGLSPTHVKTIIDLYVGNTEFVLSDEFWSGMDKEQRGRVRACLSLGLEMIKRFDLQEKEVRKMLQES